MTDLAPNTAPRTMRSTLRILVADDHDILRLGLKQLLASKPGWEICGEAKTGREAVALAEKLKPDVVVMDISMPELNGLEAARRIHKLFPKTGILILTLTAAPKENSFINLLSTAHSTRYFISRIRIAGPGTIGRSNISRPIRQKPTLSRMSMR